MSSGVYIMDNCELEKTLNHIIKKMNDYTVEAKWTRNKNKDCLAYRWRLKYHTSKMDA